MLRSFVRGFYRGLGPLQLPFLVALFVVYVVLVMVLGFLAGLVGREDDAASRR